MASRSLKQARRGFERDLALEERTSRMRPNALNSGNEQQSELAPLAPLAPSLPRLAPAGTPRARPKPAAPSARPPSTPRQRPYDLENDAILKGGAGDYRSAVAPAPAAVAGSVMPPPDLPGPLTLPDFSLPQFDPTGAVTGQNSPSASASSVGGPPAALAAGPPPAPMAGPPGPPVAADLGMPGLLDSLGAYLKRAVPPLRNPF